MRCLTLKDSEALPLVATRLRDTQHTFDEKQKSVEENRERMIDGSRHGQEEARQLTLSLAEPKAKGGVVGAEL